MVRSRRAPQPADQRVAVPSVVGAEARDRLARKTGRPRAWRRPFPLSVNSAQRRSAMKTVGFVCAAVAGFVVASGANATINDSEATQLTKKYNCAACHAVDKKLVGPAFKDVAKKYAGDKSAPQKLAQKVKTGGS